MIDRSLRLAVALVAVSSPPARAEPPAKARTAAVRARAVSARRPGHCVNPQWSRDGKAVAYERVFVADRKIELDVLDDVFGKARERKVTPPKPEPDGDGSARRAAARFKSRATAARGDVCRELAWGPASEPDVFVFACNETGGEYHLFYSGGAQLTDGPGAAGQPALSPVGWRLAFVSGSSGVGGLRLVDDLMDGASPRSLLRKPGRLDRSPIWGPKGRAVAFVGHDETSADLYLVPDAMADVPTLVRLTRDPADELNPSWSPDGKTLAFFSNRGKGTDDRGYDLYAIAAKAGAAPRRLARNVVLNEKHGPSWTPDGRWLVYIKDHQGRGAVDPIYAVPAAGGAARRIETDTVANQDPVVAAHAGRWWVAFSALGYRNAKKLAWRRVFVAPVDKLKKR